MAFVAPLFAAAAPFLSVASGVVGVVGALSQGNANAASENNAAQAAAYNATINRQRADMALQQGNAQEEAQRRESRRAMGSMRAGLVENGIALDSGTGADLVAESSLNSEMDALNIRYGAQINARGYNAQAELDDYSAESARGRAKEAKKAGWLGAASSVLTAAGGYYQGVQSKRLYDAQMKAAKG
jgi:hypothetical protein